MDLDIIAPAWTALTPTPRPVRAAYFPYKVGRWICTADKQVFLIGDINVDAGICDDCRFSEDIVRCHPPLSPTEIAEIPECGWR